MRVAKKAPALPSALAACGFAASDLVHVPAVTGFSPLGPQREYWVHVRRGLILFCADPVTPDLFQEMRSALYAMGEERNQNVVGVGRDVAAFAVRAEKVKMLTQGAGK